MDQNYELWLELIQLWDNDSSSEQEPAMSLNDQAKYLAKKHPITITNLNVRRFDSETEQEINVEEDRTLVCFKDVIVKYRPHLHMGDYWLDVIVINGSPNYRFYYFIDLPDGLEPYNAQHPHLNGGKPCLGTHGPQLATAFAEKNFIRFMSQMKAYLGTYTGNDTYHRGTHYKKIPLCGQLYSHEQIKDIFSEDIADNGNSFDTFGVAKDPMRWNFPKGMAAWNSVEIQGQTRKLLQPYFNKVEYPGLCGMYGNSELHEFRFMTRESIVAKIMGYVLVALIAGELPLFHAFEFVRVFLLTLKSHYHGTMGEKTMSELQDITNNIYSTLDRGKVFLNSRYTISLDQPNRDEIGKLWEIVSPYRSDARSSNNYLKQIKWGGDKLTNFIVLLRKQAPHKAASNYLYSTLEAIDVNDIQIRYDRVKKFAYGLALQQIEKDKRRFVNELNKRIEVGNTIDDVGQGTLFS